MGDKQSKNLSKEEVAFLQTHTGYDSDTINELHADFKRDCPNGKLTCADLMDMYMPFFPTEYSRKAFSTFDTDNNGFIDFKEFLMAINVISEGTDEEKIKWAFRLCDVDSKGGIEEQEAAKVVQAIRKVSDPGHRLPPDKDIEAEKMAKKVFVRMDTNNSGRLTEEEFVAGCMQDDEIPKLLAPKL